MLDYMEMMIISKGFKIKATIDESGHISIHYCYNDKVRHTKRLTDDISTADISKLISDWTDNAHKDNIRLGMLKDTLKMMDVEVYEY